MIRNGSFEDWSARSKLVKSSLRTQVIRHVISEVNAHHSALDRNNPVPAIKTTSKTTLRAFWKRWVSDQAPDKANRSSDQHPYAATEIIEPCANYDPWEHHASDGNRELQVVHGEAVALIRYVRDKYFIRNQNNTYIVRRHTRQNILCSLNI